MGKGEEGREEEMRGKKERAGERREFVPLP